MAAPVDLGIRGKVALVAAASQGMGRATALALAREGCKVAICARNEGPLQATVKAIRKETGAEVLGITARGGGAIVAITSISVKQPIENLLLSNAMRAAVVGLVKTLARELGPSRIRVNAVAPGWIATDRLTELTKIRADREGKTLAAA